MAISDARAVYGLSALGTNSRTGVVGSALIGETPAQLRLTDATTAYVVRAIFAGAGDELVLNLLTGSATGSTTFVAGNAQVETATITAAGGCTTTGIMTLVLTSSGMTGSPLNVAVPLTTAAHTTATLVAAAARTALESDAVVAARFTIGGSGAVVSITRKPTVEYTEGATTVPIYGANDATLNLAIPSELGITAAASSADTTAGVATDGVKIFGDGVDFEGVALVAMADVLAASFALSTGDISYADGSSESGRIGISGAENRIFAGGISINFGGTFTFTSSGAADITITVVGL